MHDKVRSIVEYYSGIANGVVTTAPYKLKGLVFGITARARARARARALLEVSNNNSMQRHRVMDSKKVAVYIISLFQVHPYISHY